jgi:hypothetical protein
MRVDALSCSKDGAGDGVRTRDVQLGNFPWRAATTGHENERLSK